VQAVAAGVIDDAGRLTYSIYEVKVSVD